MGRRINAWQAQPAQCTCRYRPNALLRPIVSPIVYNLHAYNMYTMENRRTACHVLTKATYLLLRHNFHVILWKHRAAGLAYVSYYFGFYMTPTSHWCFVSEIILVECWSLILVKNVLLGCCAKWVCKRYGRPCG